MLVWIKRVILAVLVLFLIIQIIRPSRKNPPVNTKLEISASQSVSPAVDSIFLRSCNDCHSNRTVWPWYSNVAPASWLVVYDVNKGRTALNFSEWAPYPAEKRNELLKEICKEVSDGEMPGIAYTLPHPVARLTDADVQTICQWTQAAGQSLSSENE